MSYTSFIGMKTHLRNPKNTFFAIFIFSATSGRFRPHIASTKFAKITKNLKNRDFSKIDIFLYSGRKYDFLPKIGPLDLKNHPETLYWPPYEIWLQFRKNEKNRIFHLKNQGKKFFRVDFFGRRAPITKSILGIDRPYWCTQTPIILLYTTYPFLAICIIKNSVKFQKTSFFPESVVFVAFVAFWVLLMLFFKIFKIRRCCYLFLFFRYDV